MTDDANRKITALKTIIIITAIMISVFFFTYLNKIWYRLFLEIDMTSIKTFIGHQRGCGLMIYLACLIDRVASTVIHCFFVNIMIIIIYKM